MIGAVKIFVVGQIRQYRIGAAPAHRELDGTFAQALLQFIEIEIVPAARIADDDDGLRLDAPARHRPEILVIVQRRAIANRTAINFPCAGAAAMTISTTTTVIPRHGSCGIGRSYSRGGPPCTLSTCGGLRKNKRGSRSLSLKLEVDEGIAVSLSENNGAGHEGPCRRHNPARQTQSQPFRCCYRAATNARESCQR